MSNLAYTHNSQPHNSSGVMYVPPCVDVFTLSVMSPQCDFFYSAGGITTAARDRMPNNEKWGVGMGHDFQIIL